MIEAIKIDPQCRYVLFARDVPPEWLIQTERSLASWWDAPSRVMMINIPKQGTVYLEKIRKVDNEAVHQSATE